MIDLPSSPVGVAVGDPHVLSCISRNSPPDTFTWMKDGVEIDPSLIVITLIDSATATFKTTYTINSVTTSDSGTYTCTVTNPIGSDSKSITVAVGESIRISMQSLRHL